MQYTSRDKRIILILTLIAVPLTGIGLDVYVPSLPDIQHLFGVSQTAAKLSISCYLLGLGAYTLFSAFFIDGLKRRTAVMPAMLAFFILSLIIPFSPSMGVLSGLRFVQGLAVGGLNVPLRAMIAEVSEGREFVKMLNMVTIAWAIGPIIAPVIGGYLHHY